MFYYCFLQRTRASRKRIGTPVKKIFRPLSPKTRADRLKINTYALVRATGPGPPSGLPGSGNLYRLPLSHPKILIWYNLQPFIFKFIIIEPPSCGGHQIVFQNYTFRLYLCQNAASVLSAHLPLLMQTLCLTPFHKT